MKNIVDLCCENNVILSIGHVNIPVFSGIVGLSAVPAQGLPQNLTASLTQPGIAVVTTTQSSDPRQVQRSVSFTPVSTVSASGGTIHHHGQSPTRGAPLVSNLPHNIISMNVNQAAQIVQRRSSQGAASSNPGTPVTGRVVLDTRQILSHPLSHITSTVTRHVQSTGQPPKKKAKLEERPPATPEIAQQRKMILDAKYKEMMEIKENYVEHLTELFFLQHGRNLMDYLAWKKRPTPQLVAFLKAGALDSDEEEEHLQEKRINDEVIYSLSKFIKLFIARLNIYKSWDLSILVTIDFGIYLNFFAERDLS